MDDVLMFLNRGIGDLTTIQNIIHLFKTAIGMAINNYKSAINVSEWYPHEITFALQRFPFSLNQIDEGLRYLGYTLKLHGYKIANWIWLITTLEKRLHIWEPPTPISSGTVFVNYRKKTLQGGNRNAMWAEWSVDKESDPKDEALWYQTNPSLGTIFTERSIYDEIGSDKIDFNIQRLGLWIKYNQKSAISAVEWERLEVDRLPKLKSPLYIGIKYGKDGENVAMSIAVKTTRDRIFIESIDCQTLRNGNDWIIDFLSQADIARVAVDGASGQHTLAEQMKQARLKKPILPTVKEVIKANFLWEQAIYQETLCHKDQASLSQVVTNCEKRAIGSNGGFGYESQYDDMDIALMDSALLAHWLCSENKHTRRQQVRY